ncbi:similar to Saccharomyces cerevisiae YIL156W UBP7 Ubiquitin-specific protease that cleaves ubiquitin-protein fusions [Maudiozyma saulgeensis]|uniref:ubiquitinyl hydrolase 1 n=1 Tax=Maudiozyma saulgeensis TaxID=1789683 RepID=A0A1X7QWW6_9SACH|nr:similar to Saccharomyces cerevisiae YIL156W UBP7 Ubiquitin-specific protease that cleaves ubiquitin-protein fusions [Kazachstania saulgeensis]
MNKEKVVLFSPEYSPELAKRIKSIYKDDIKHYYSQLKLEKLIDLLEHTQYLFELYVRFVNDKNDNDSLTSYIIGCFYVYLIMPKSIQFQTKNKDYSIYTDMKAIYEGQMNMTNVRLMVRDEIDHILDRTSPEQINLTQLMERKRAYSVPDDSISESLQKLKINDPMITTTTKNLDEIIPYKNNQNGSQPAGSSYSSSITSTEDDEYNSSNVFSGHQDTDRLPINSDSELFTDEGDSASQLWTAPALEPNDQLKIALYSEPLTLPAIPTEEDFSQPIEFPKYNEVNEGANASNISGTNNTISDKRAPLLRARTESIAMSMFDESNNRNLYENNAYPYSNYRKSPLGSSEELIADRSLTHRKNSYHSVYMMENDNDELKNENYYDQTDDFIRSIERLEKQSIITAPELFSILTNPIDRKKLLLIDLRLEKRYAYNNIIADNYVQLDPTVLWDSEKGTPIYDIKIIEQSLNNELFTHRNEFDYIVYYSDMKTYMKLNFDYHFVLFYLLITSVKSTDKFKRAPTALLGGFEKWKKMMHKYTKEYDIDVRQYIYGPYDREGKKISQTVASPTNTDSNNDRQAPYPSEKVSNNKFPEAPSFRPPEVPFRIRKRPPPPPPATRPKTPPPPMLAPPGIPPRLPAKIKMERNSNSPITRIPSHIPVLPSTIPENRQMTKFELFENKNKQSVKTRSYSIPTIEKNSNIFVSLSITGLRNLGNTCYINSMIQCLFSTTAFRDLFLSNEYEKYLNMSDKHISANSRKLSLSKSLNILFRKMYLNGGCSVVPIAFLKTCSILRPDLKIPDDQQDTQEFLMLMLDRLHDELSKQNEVVNKNPKLLLYDTAHLKVNEKEYKKWFDENVMGNGLSPIDDFFQGQMESCLQCERCGYCTYNYSSFYVLSLAIPKKQKSFTKLSKSINLEDCISMFTADEILSGENAWNCPRCYEEQKRKLLEKKKKVKQSQNLQIPTKSHERSREKHSIFKFGGSKRKKPKTINRSLSPFRLIKRSESKNREQENSIPITSSSEADHRYNTYEESEDDFDELDDEKLRHWKNKKLVTVKTLNFITLPKVLMIHLSRFYYDLTKKNNTIITYPLILTMTLKNKEVVKYRLYALVNHTGNLISGHYTSLINKDYDHSLGGKEQKWYYFDDEVVKEERNHGNIDNGINKISSKDVYVLFYQRIN